MDEIKKKALEMKNENNQQSCQAEKSNQAEMSKKDEL